MQPARASTFATIALGLAIGLGLARADEPSPLQVRPQAVRLGSPEDSQQLLVWVDQDAQQVDVSRRVRYQSDAPGIVVVTDTGRVLPWGEGATQILVELDNDTVRIPVEVRGLKSPSRVSFRHEVVPILSKAGCNAGGCHGKAEGQNGFKLSVFGFDPQADFGALVQEGRGRRVSTAAPQHSLLLRKATAELPHGGGRKLEQDGLWYRRLSRWIAEGAPLDEPSTDRVTAIEVAPAEILLAPKSSQQLQVTALDAAGRRRCVTVEAEYQSNADAIAGVDGAGLITGTDVPGEAAILVRYMGQVAVARVTLPRMQTTFARPRETNFVDRAVWDKLQRLGIEPSPPVDDATFLRRVYLDTIGTLPTAEEAREFLADASPDKRTRLIDGLLQRDEYADYWAMRWSDILRVDSSIVTPRGAVAMSRWLRRQFHDNTPFDQFARQIITARGDTLAESPAGFYKVHKDPELAARALSQVFLGVRIECAQCHHHPFEHWGQEDYYRFAGFFTGLSHKSSACGGEKIVVAEGKDLNHPRTQQPVPTAALGAAPAELTSVADRRVVLADWMTAPDNPFFARMIANRLWAHYFGRGLVEPVDDLRATNPATNEPLLDALTAHLVEVRYDLKAFTRTLLQSHAYQLSSRTTATNASDEQNFSRAAWKPLPAEVLLDAMCQATAVAEQFNGWPEGYRAVQVWDNRMPSYFLAVFGRPQRTSVCECERGDQPSIAQALHLMNSPETVRKIRHRDGRAAALARSEHTDDRAIEELYLCTLSRFPSEPELALMRQAFSSAGSDRRAAVEDVLWTLLNTKEFLYNH